MISIKLTEGEVKKLTKVMEQYNGFSRLLRILDNAEHIYIQYEPRETAEEDLKWYIAGIDGDHTPDPAYWRDRWELIKARDHHHARREYIRIMDGWLRPDEQKHVFTDEVNVRDYTNEFDQVHFHKVRKHTRLSKGGE